MERLSAVQLLDIFGVSHLQEVSTFGALRDETITDLIEHGELLALQPGEVLFNAGDRSDGFYVILQGHLAFYKYHNGQYAFIRDYHFGENIGFVGMIALHRRIGRAQAGEATIVLRVSVSQFNALYERDTREFALLLMNLARDMARGIRAIDNIIVEQSLAAEGGDRPSDVA